MDRKVMKASEVILKLQTLIEEHGDLPVSYDDDGTAIKRFTIILSDGYFHFF